MQRFFSPGCKGRSKSTITTEVAELKMLPCASNVELNSAGVTVPESRIRAGRSRSVDRWIFELPVHGVNVRQALLGQLDIKGANVFLELLHGCGSNDDARHKPPDTREAAQVTCTATLSSFMSCQ
jgi:hypothetical protein